jgi:hypothetical protein
MNQMKEEKENLILKFLGFFIGPIQFVMEVSDQLFTFPRFGVPIAHIATSVVASQ